VKKSIEERKVLAAAMWQHKPGASNAKKNMSLQHECVRSAKAREVQFSKKEQNISKNEKQKNRNKKSGSVKGKYSKERAPHRIEGKAKQDKTCMSHLGPVSAPKGSRTALDGVLAVTAAAVTGRTGRHCSDTAAPPLCCTQSAQGGLVCVVYVYVCVCVCVCGV
jgi:hypothetical protein